MKIQYLTKSLHRIIRYHIYMNEIQYLTKSFLHDYKISYMNDFQDYYILQIFQPLM